MHVDPVVPLLATIALTLFVSGFVLRKLGQPYVIGYLVGGIVMGPHVLGIVEHGALLTQLGGLGVVLLLFFVGMEISPQRLIANWRVAAIGTGLQIGISVACIFVLGWFLDWPVGRIVLLGFVISLSSTAVALRLVKEGRYGSSELGDQVTGILLAQDVALVPMLLILGFLGTGVPATSVLITQSVGAIAFIGVIIWVARAKIIHLPLGKLAGDPELQVFAGLIFCFGLGMLTGMLGLSTALGAFLAGLIMSAAKETHWIHSSLEPFRVVFVALFFVSVGMLLDLDFVVEHLGLVIGLTIFALATNTFINAGILRFFGTSWRESIIGGGLLAQIGELSFLLTAIGSQADLVSDFSHQTTVAVITMSLILSPAWLGILVRFGRPRVA